MAAGAAWPPAPYEAGGWARTFAGLGFGLELPAPGEGEEGWGEFVSSSWRLPYGLAAAGGLAAAAVPTALYLYPTKVRGAQGSPGQAWAQFIGACCATLVCLGASANFCLRWRGFAAAAGELQGAAEALGEAGALAASLGSSGGTMSQDLDALYGKCPGSVRVSLGSSINAVKTQVGKYVEEVGRLGQTLSAAGDWAGELQRGGAAAAGDLAPYRPLPLLAALGCCLGVAIPVAIAAEKLEDKYARRLRSCNLLCVSIGLVAPAMLLISLVTAAELALGIQSGTFCMTPDAAVVSYVASFLANASALQAGGAGVPAGNASFSGLQLAGYYIDGNGPNSALESLKTAEGEIDKSVAWVKKYGAPLSKVCPRHSFASIIADLRTVKSNLTKEKALLAPEKIHAFYNSAVHELACGTAISGLGWAVFFQVLLGLACLPALVFTASCLLDGLENGREFRPISRDEQVGSSDEEEEQGFNMMYKIVYIFSVVLFAIGALLYFIPSMSIIRRIVGTLLFGCGTFLLTNSDLVVTYVRMKIQISRFEENNAHFAKNLDEQATHIRTLQKASQGLRELDKQFAGNMQKAMQQVGKLKVTARTSIAMCARQLCRLYSDSEKDGVISSGAELDHNFEMMGTVFGGIVDHYGDRATALRASLTFHPKYQKAQGLKVDTFGKLMEAALREESANSIPDVVKRIMDKEK